MFKVQRLFVSIFVFLFLACNGEFEEKRLKTISVKEINNKNELKLSKILGERIDGPANIRVKPNGEILFELNDNVLVESTPLDSNGWYQVMVYADLDAGDLEIDSIEKDREIIIENDTVGKVLKSHPVSTGQRTGWTYAMLYGYTHKKNIKPKTIIEKVFKESLLKNGRNKINWKDFIRTFDLDTNAMNYSEFDTYYNYENSIEDPSPGFRLVLLFENNNLIGFVHSRGIQTKNSIIHKLEKDYFVTFFNDADNAKQNKFMEYANEWLKGVD